MARAAQASANIITFLISVGLISGGPTSIIIAPVAVTVVSSLVNLINVRALIICCLRSTCTTDRRLDSIPELRSIHRRHITASIDRECIGGPERCRGARLADFPACDPDSIPNVYCRQLRRRRVE